MTTFAELRIGEYDAVTVPFDVAKAYAESLCKHITFVRIAARNLGIPETQTYNHDESKYSRAEFGPYALNFHGGASTVDDPRIKADFAAAWLHHIHHNPHHWQHWIFSDGWTPAGSGIVDGVLPMPNHYAAEMVADWMGASMAYTGSWGMTDWLLKNIPRIRLHPQTAETVRGILDGLGYADILGLSFASEPQ